MNIGSGSLRALLDGSNVFQGNQTFLNAVVESLYLTTGERRILMSERTDPPPPPANTVYVYCRDNGAGKTQFVVRFATGPIRVLATQA